MRESGLYCDSDVIHAQCLGFLYTSILQDELHGAARFGNVHRIRPSSNPEPKNAELNPTRAAIPMLIVTPKLVAFGRC